MNKLTPKAKQKLCGLACIIFGIISSTIIMPEEYGWGILISVIGVLLVLTKKQILDFD